MQRSVKHEKPDCGSEAQSVLRNFLIIREHLQAYYHCLCVYISNMHQKIEGFRRVASRACFKKLIEQHNQDASEQQSYQVGNIFIVFRINVLLLFIKEELVQSDQTVGSHTPTQSQARP